LFCGLGAFHQAFNFLTTNKLKYKCVFACDINDSVRRIYKENYNVKAEGDINKIDINKIPDFDILCGGFPCQPFSIAGSKKGFNDIEKGNLFFAILKIIDIKLPKILVLENVNDNKKKELFLELSLDQFYQFLASMEKCKSYLDFVNPTV
jgi:DNA (cytosine-5)-methyltransferase 1